MTPVLTGRWHARPGRPRSHPTPVPARTGHPRPARSMVFPAQRRHRRPPAPLPCLLPDRTGPATAICHPIGCERSVPRAVVCAPWLLPAPFAPPSSIQKAVLHFRSTTVALYHLQTPTRSTGAPSHSQTLLKPTPSHLLTPARYSNPRLHWPSDWPSHLHTPLAPTRGRPLSPRSNSARLLTTHRWVTREASTAAEHEGGKAV